MPETTPANTASRVATPLISSAGATKAVAMLWEFWPMKAYGFRALSNDELLIIVTGLGMLFALIAGWFRRRAERRHELWEIERATQWLAIRDRMGPVWPVEGAPPPSPIPNLGPVA